MIPLSAYSPRKRPASSRLRAERGLGQVVGAEGEEIGALADLAGHQAGAGQLDHGADRISEARAPLLLDLVGHRRDALLDQVELGLGGDERHHDLRHDAVVQSPARLDRRLEDGAGLHLDDLRDSSPAVATPRWPSIGLNSLSAATRRLRRVTLTPMAAATSPMAASPCGRNSCSGGSSRRMVTGRPAMISNSSTKSWRCVGRSLASAARRPSWSSARIISRIGEDAVLLEEHMLGAAKPDAVGAEGARLLARRPACRHWRAPACGESCRPSASA